MSCFLKTLVAIALSLVASCQVAMSASLILEPIYGLPCNQIKARWHDGYSISLTEISENIRLLGSLLDDGACEETNPDFERAVLILLIDQILNVTPSLDEKVSRVKATNSKNLAETAAAYFSDWKLHELVADHARLDGDLAIAREQYGAALASYESKQFVYTAPSPSQIMKIHSKLVEVTNVWVQTGASLDDIKSTRAGGPSDGLSLNWRSWTTQKSLIPLKFKFASVAFSREGQEIARSILGDLESQKVQKLLIVGHTDPKGSDHYNMLLSKSRAEAVRDFLKSEGFEGEIVVDWKGEREPFEFDSIALYTEEQQDAAHRRVVFEILEKSNK